MNQKATRSGIGARLFITAFLVGSGFVVAGQESKSPSDKKADGPPTHTVARGAIKSKAQLDAVLEATEMEAVKVEPKAWTDLTVLEAVTHGARVKKGDTLVKLDLAKLTEQIEDLEQDRLGATLALELATAELDNLKQSTPLKLEAAKRTQRQADEDYGYFQSTGRSQREKSVRFGLKNAEQRLDGANEELAQLQKMYEADDLTEETEEIILKRQKFAVEAAEYGLEATKLNADLSLKTSIPREHETLRSQKRDQELALTLAEQNLPKGLLKKQLDLEKMKRDQRKSDRKLADLQRDFDSLSIQAPMDGIVYYGACENGKWLTGATVARKLIPTGKLTANEVFMTVVNPKKLVLKAVVPESDLSHFKIGMEGKASPVSAPEKKLATTLEELGYIPLPGGGFEAKMSLKLADGVRLMPGMMCKVAFGETEKPDGLLAPKGAVFGEAKQQHVFVLTKDGPDKRMVKTGNADDKMIEIIKGLAEGDKILLSKPE